MIMDKLLSSAQILSKNFHNDDDFIDRINHRYTTTILIIFSIIVSTKQYVGDPINCWCPAQFTTSHVKYANSICWVQNTYYVPITIEHIGGSGPKKNVVYYQWIPMILLFLGSLFYCPRLFWKVMNSRSGVAVSDMVETAKSINLTKKEINRERTLHILVQIMHRYLMFQKESSQSGCIGQLRWRLRHLLCCCGTNNGNFLVAIYILTKFGYLINIICQIFLLNIFLGQDFHLYGIRLFHSLLKNREFSVSDFFPRVTLCDFQIRTLNNIQGFTLQCVLPINLFNEKIFVFLWFWLLILLFLNISRLISWICNVISTKDQVRYIRSQIKIISRYKKLKKKSTNKNLDKQNDYNNNHQNFTLFIQKFFDKYLRQDGILILRLIGINVNQIIVAELIDELFTNWITSYQDYRRLNISSEISDDDINFPNGSDV